MRFVPPVVVMYTWTYKAQALKGTEIAGRSKPSIFPSPLLRSGRVPRCEEYVLAVLGTKVSLRWSCIDLPDDQVRPSSIVLPIRFDPPVSITLHPYA